MGPRGVPRRLRPSVYPSQAPSDWLRWAYGLRIDYNAVKASKLGLWMIKPDWGKKTAPPVEAFFSTVIVMAVTLADLPQTKPVPPVRQRSRSCVKISQELHLHLDGGQIAWASHFGTPRRKPEWARTTPRQTAGYCTSIPNFLSFSKYFWTLLATCRGVRRPLIACEIFAHLRTIQKSEWTQTRGCGQNRPILFTIGYLLKQPLQETLLLY